MSIILRHGDERIVLAGETCDLLCVDAPYSERTHQAYSPRTDVSTACERDAKWAARGGVRQHIDYDAWTPERVRQFVWSWSPRTRGWFVVISDDILGRVWQEELTRCERYVFPLIPFIEPGSRVRLGGDGPSCWTCWVVIAARPRTHEFSKWGTLRGAYILPPGQSDPEMMIGGKPLWLMRALVRDYSRPGNIVCDPCAGNATTLIAAASEGRLGLGAELSASTYDGAQVRIASGYSLPLFLDNSSAAGSDPLRALTQIEMELAAEG